VYLIDTNVISETGKKERADPGVVRFFDRCALVREGASEQAILQTVYLDA